MMDIAVCNLCGKNLGEAITTGEHTCKSCLNKSVIKDLFFKTVVPVALAAFLLYMAFLPLKSSTSGIELYLKMLFFAGIPFGLKKMCAFIVPFGHDIAATVAIFALNFIVGGIIGAFVLAWRLIYAVFNLIKSAVLLIQIAGSAM